MKNFIVYVELNDSCEMSVSEFKKPLDENKKVPIELTSAVIAFYKKSYNTIRLPLYNAIQRELNVEYTNEAIQLSNKINRIVFNICNKNKISHSKKGIEFHNSCESFESALIYNMFCRDIDLNWRYIKHEDKRFECVKALYDSNTIPLIVDGEWMLYDTKSYECIHQLN